MIGFATRAKPIQQQEMSFLLCTVLSLFMEQQIRSFNHLSTAQSDVVNAASHESDEINVSLVFIFNLFI